MVKSLKILLILLMAVFLLAPLPAAAQSNNTQSSIDLSKDSSVFTGKNENTKQFSCQVPKKKCSEMTSCSEAQFYLKQCDVTRLDGNKNGIPCESICKKSK